MALKNKLRSQRSKRFDSVVNDCDSKSEEMNFSSTDSEPEGYSGKIKVRKGFSAKRLMKESESFTVDNDHIYSSARPSGTIYNSVRTRKISEESDEKPAKKRCFSKNAVMARLNRERKKKYISSLETENESLRKENNELNKKVEEQNKKITIMKREISYLKGLLANSKELEQILRNLRDVTGLPVTSSIIPGKTKVCQNEGSLKSSTTEQEDQKLVEYHPRIKTVASGYNFPILDKDINLGSCSDNSFNDMTDVENCPFHFESDSYDLFTPSFNDEDYLFNLSNKNLDLELEKSLEIENLSEKGDPQVGICLHVNQKRISVEICSICNNKAVSSFDDFPDEVFLNSSSDIC